MRKVMVLLVMGFLLVSPAFADVFGNGQNDFLKVSQPVSLNADQTTQVQVEPATVIEIVSKVLSSIGSRAGYGYDYLRHERVATVGGTLFTIHNIAATIDMYNADGAGIGVAYNLGSLLPTQTSPIAKYIDYCYLGTSFGSRYSDKWRGSGVIELSVKFTN